MGFEVLLYWPNIIGYIRICLVLGSWAVHETPTAFILLYTTSILLDGVDGWLARRLNQCSRFGAWLDVVVDNVGRAMLWSLIFQGGWLVSAVEWCVFVCNHGGARGGHDWKNSFTSSPLIIRAIMANGFQTPLGLLVVSGLHCLPLWLYSEQRGLLEAFLPFWIQVQVTLLLTGGRLLAFSAEVWCIWTHIKYLTKDLQES